jgi:hypothetical protein
MKKIIVLFLLVCIWSVFGKDTFTCMTNDVGQVVLTGYSGDSRVVIVPAGVNVIGRDVFCNRLGIAVIYLPDSVSRIDERAFYGVSNLRQVRLPVNLEFIHETSFDYCINLDLVYTDNKRLVIEWNSGEHRWTPVRFSYVRRPWIDFKDNYLIFEGDLERSTDGKDWELVETGNSLYKVVETNNVMLYRCKVKYDK